MTSATSKYWAFVKYSLFCRSLSNRLVQENWFSAEVLECQLFCNQEGLWTFLPVLPAAFQWTFPALSHLFSASDPLTGQ